MTNQTPIEQTLRPNGRPDESGPRQAGRGTVLTTLAWPPSANEYERRAIVGKALNKYTLQVHPTYTNAKDTVSWVTRSPSLNNKHPTTL